MLVLHRVCYTYCIFWGESASVTLIPSKKLSLFEVDMSKISLSEVHQADPTTSSAEPNSVDTEASSRTMAEDTTEKSAVEPELTYPEGGARGWAVAIGGATILFSTFGYANAYGYV